MHHSSLQDWWHVGPGRLRRKRTQEGHGVDRVVAICRMNLGDSLEGIDSESPRLIRHPDPFSNFHPFLFGCPKNGILRDLRRFLDVGPGQDSMYHTKERQQESAEINTSMLGLCPLLEPLLDTLQLFPPGVASCPRYRYIILQRSSGLFADVFECWQYAPVSLVK